MSVIKPDAGDIKHRRFGTHLWRKPEGQEFGLATVGRARACSVAVMAMHSAPTTISTPITARPTPQCHRNTRYGSVLPVTEGLPSGRMNSVGNRSGTLSRENSHAAEVASGVGHGMREQVGELIGTRYVAEVEFRRVRAVTASRAAILPRALRLPCRSTARPATD